MKPVILACAPVAHQGSEIPAGVTNPLDPQTVAAEVAACAEAGVTVVHLHVRDDQGKLSFDLDQYRRTLDLLESAGTRVLINGSTGGFSDLTLEERCVALEEPRTQIASLNMGSVNVNDTVYINTMPDIRFWAGKMKERGVVPELEVFDLSMIEQCRRLRDEGLLPHHLHFNFCFGFPGALDSDPAHLAYLVSRLPEDSSFGVIHEGMEDLSLLAAAVAFGADQIRVGFEDSFFVKPGRSATSNRELVEAMAAMVRSLGREVADYSGAADHWLA